MKQAKHILVLLALLIAGVGPLWAQDAELGGLHCGDIVTITATPDPGYQFSHWSDGNTDNPRDIEITEAVELTAIYEPVCRQDQVPTVWLYNQLMMVNVDSLQRMGYTFSEQNVTWYRIVGDNDATSAQNDDERLGTGYYYNLKPEQIGLFYAAVDISATPPFSPPRCSDILYSAPINHGMTDLDDINASNQLALIPNFGPPGTLMQLIGLLPAQHYTIYIYDAVGHLLEEYALSGKEQYTLSAQHLPGYYIVKVINKNGECVLRYMVSQ